MSEFRNVPTSASLPELVSFLYQHIEALNYTISQIERNQQKQEGVTGETLMAVASNSEAISNLDSGKVGNSYIKTVYVDGSDTIRIRTRYNGFAPDKWRTRQTFLISGNANGQVILAQAEVSGEGKIHSVSGGITCSADLPTGTLLVKLPQQAWDDFVVISGRPFSV